MPALLPAGNLPGAFRIFRARDNRPACVYKNEAVMLWLIRRQLKSKNPASRREAAARLGSHSGSQALAAVREALADDDAEVRRLAATALGTIDDISRIELLLLALHDRNAEVQRAAILALRKARDERITAALVPLLRHGDAGVRGSAAQALDTLGWQPANRDDEIWFLVDRGQCSRAASFGVDALAPLEAALSSGTYSLCISAVRALGEIDDRRVVRPLLKALKSEDTAICGAAIDALARIGGPEALEPITEMLRHTTPQVRLAAVESLRTLGVATAIEPLRPLLTDSVWEVRRATVETLGYLKDPRAVEALTPTLSDGDPDVREATAMTLGNLGDRRAIGPLVLALKDLTSGVRRMAAAALSRIDENWRTSPEAQAAIEDLRGGLYDSDSDVRYFIGHLLVRLGAMEPESAVGTALAEPPPTLAERQRKLAVNLFLAILGDHDRDLRQACAEALGRLGERRAEPSLIRALQDPDPGVRYASERALQAIALAHAR